MKEEVAKESMTTSNPQEIAGHSKEVHFKDQDKNNKDSKNQKISPSNFKYMVKIRKT